jgi:hypothetical protein
MARTVRLTSTGDLDVTNGRAHMISGGEATTQLLQNRLLSIYGEWFYGRRRGVRYFEDVLGFYPEGSLLEAIFVDVVRGTTGITGLNKLELDLDPLTRELLVDVDANSGQGNITIEGLRLGG